jgi:hypothetical protein
MGAREPPELRAPLRERQLQQRFAVGSGQEVEYDQQRRASSASALP